MINELDIISFIEQFPDESVLCFLVGIVFVISCFFFLSLIESLYNLIFETLQQKRISSCCYGFHHGSIVGVCRHHVCPYSDQCVYHAPRRGLRRYMQDLFNKVK